MSLYEQWKEIAYKERNQEDYDAFWGEYLPKEQVIYAELLKEYETPVSGTVNELAEKYNLDTTTFAGFLDGINTSLTESIDLETITEDSPVTLSINFRNLYYNMHAATADWLYNLEEWDPILTLDERKEIKKEYNRSKIIVKDKKINRNDPCPCGSGKKYKQCCINKE
jgi:preprotein translocase subunit SecA